MTWYYEMERARNYWVRKNEALVLELLKTNSPFRFSFLKQLLLIP